MDVGGERRRHALELAAASSTLAVWIASKAFPWHLQFILGAIACWMAYGLWRLRRREEWLRWGLRSGVEGWQGYFGFTVAAVLAMVAVAVARGIQWPTLPWVVWPLYAAWAGAQQFAVQNIVVKPLAGLGVKVRLLPVLAGALFAAGHAPRWGLALLAGAGGMVWTWLYLRKPNFWLVAVSHAVVGAVALTLLLGANPLSGFLGVPFR